MDIDRSSPIVILTGAGISAESGLATFRDQGGLWEGHSIEDVATPQGFHKNPDLVFDFYNTRRREAANARPNAAHNALAALENAWGDNFLLITQNVDDLHEKAGSSRPCICSTRFEPAFSPRMLTICMKRRVRSGCYICMADSIPRFVTNAEAISIGRVILTGTVSAPAAAARRCALTSSGSAKCPTTWTQLRTRLQRPDCSLRSAPPARSIPPPVSWPKRRAPVRARWRFVDRCIHHQGIDRATHGVHQCLDTAVNTAQVAEINAQMVKPTTREVHAISSSGGSDRITGGSDHRPAAIDQSLGGVEAHS